ncbi:MAG: PBP1A family penicillin-binding protein [Candidatus Xenobiia bacterium LiM19]
MTDSSRGTQKKKMSSFVKFLFVVFFTLLFLIFFTIGLSVTLVQKYSKDLPDVRKLSRFEPSESSQIFSSNGTLIGVLFKENRIWVSIDDIPKTMQDAIIATEDSRFYEHVGVDPKGIARAVIENFRGGGLSQGASTITQQLARNIFLSQERSVKRKIQEVLISVDIEKRFSKKEILEYYFNQIYFGSGAYGIEAAAQTYFGKHAKALTLPECALIAGLPAAPSLYSPLVDPKMAKQRQELVLQRMLSCGYITADEEKKAREKKLVVAPKKSEIQMFKYPYFTTYALHELSKRYDDDYLYRAGLKIYTTLDIPMQNAAATTLLEGLKRAQEQNMNATNAALVAVDPRNGYIKAMVGGVKFTEKNQFNRAWQARRLPGSAFKVFVYTAALEQGYTPDTAVSDSAVTYTIPGSNDWTPKNSDGRFMGALTFRDALKWSRNICAVRTLDAVGPDEVIKLAGKMGITDPIENNLSIALGSCEVTVLDMASAYGVLANGGHRCPPTAIRKIVDSHGNVVEDNRFPKSEEVISAATAFAMTEMMAEVVSSGTGTAAQIGRPAAGKTGTTDEHRDAWFVGFVPQLSCAIWTGNDDYTQMNYVFGGTLGAGIWGSFMKKVLAKNESLEFGSDEEGRIGVMICNSSGMRATAKCNDTKKAYFTRGNVPQKYCTAHGLFALQKASPKKTAAPSNAAPTPEESEDNPFLNKSPDGSKKPHESGEPDATSTVEPVEEPGMDTGMPPVDPNDAPTEIEGSVSPADPTKGVIELPSPPKSTEDGPNTPGSVQL